MHAISIVTGQDYYGNPDIFMDHDEDESPLTAELEEEWNYHVWEGHNQ